MNECFPVTIAQLSGIPDGEFQRRWESVSKELEDQDLSGMVFFSASSICYLTGSPLMQTERPIALVYKIGGEKTLLVPRLEYEHAQATVNKCKISCYPEYPGERHPMFCLADVISQMNLNTKRLAADGMGYPGVFGYRGPSLSEVLSDCQITLLPTLIERLKVHKSRFEIDMLRESAKWANYALALLQSYTKPGLREIEVSARACNDAAKAMMQTLGHQFRPSSAIGSGIYTGYRGQIGARSYFPHAVTTNGMFHRGDTLGSGASANIYGYASELERVLFVGEPSPEQVRFYELAVQAQDVAIATIRPGKRCCDVDREMRRFFEENNMMPYWRHHTGHSLGTGDHEAPFFDIGDESPIEPGMCFSVEPGIYVEGLGGFRLSDTVVVHENHLEILTYYSRDIDALICE